MSQDYPLEPVPQEARRSVLSLYAVLLGFTFFTATMFAGGQLGAAFPFWPDLVGLVVLGNLVLATYASVLAVVAFRSGLPTAVMARFCFGDWGSRWSDILLGFTQIGWYAWGTGTVAAVAIELLNLSPNWQIPLMLFCGLFFCLTAFIGYRGLDLLARITVPLMTFLIFWSFWLSYQEAGRNGVQAPLESMSWATAITAIVGTFASGATQSTNWSRFARTQGAAVGATATAFLLGNGLMVFAGAVGASVYQEPDMVRVLVKQGIVVWAVIMLFGNIWTTQDNTIYNFSLAGCSMLRSHNRRLITLGGAALGTVLALLGFAEALVPFLLMLGIAIPPLGGVIAADFFWVWRGQYPDLDPAQPKFHWAGLVAYSVGVAAALWLPGIPPVNGIAAAAVAHALLRGRAS